MTTTESAAGQPASTGAPVEPVSAAVLRQAGRDGIELDPGQLMALERLEVVAGALGSSDAVVRPLYLWGPPGRGKTWLLDAFFSAVDTPHKRRVHFHGFFQELHRRVYAGYGAPGYRQESAFSQALDGLLGDNRLLCFDEFHVNDPADAAFTTRLLREVLARNISLVTTSNYAPGELLPDPMFHHLFEPARKLIGEHMEVLELSGSVDYRRTASPGGAPRRAAGFAAGFHVPDPAFLPAAGLQPPAREEARTLSPGTRKLRVLRASGETVWFDFADLCQSQSSVSDYLALTEQFLHWVISGVPGTEGADPDGWQRFGNVIDVLHDAGCRLDVIGLPDLGERFPGTAHPRDLARFRSRFGVLQRLPAAGAGSADQPAPA